MHEEFLLEVLSEKGHVLLEVCEGHGMHCLLRLDIRDLLGDLVDETIELRSEHKKVILGIPLGKWIVFSLRATMLF